MDNTVFYRDLETSFIFLDGKRIYIYAGASVHVQSVSSSPISCCSCWTGFVTVFFSEGTYMYKPCSVDEPWRESLLSKRAVSPALPATDVLWGKRP